MARSFPPYQRRQLAAERETNRSVTNGHGRFEVREVMSTTMLNEYLDWPGVKQVCRIARTTKGRKGKDSEKPTVSYAITSVSRERADAGQLQKWWREHWGIENKVHYVRDEAFGEDRCRVRIGTSGQVLATFRNAAMNWLRADEVASITAALRQNAWHSHRLFARFGYRNN